MNAALVVAVIALVVNVLTIILTIFRDIYARQGDITKHIQEALKVDERRNELTSEYYGVRSQCEDIKQAEVERAFLEEFHADCTLWNDQAYAEELRVFLGWFQTMVTFFQGLYESKGQRESGMYLRRWTNEEGSWYVWPVLNTYKSGLITAWRDMLAVKHIIDLRSSWLANPLGRFTGTHITPLQKAFIERWQYNAEHDFPILLSLMVAHWLHSSSKDFKLWKRGKNLTSDTQDLFQTLIKRPDCQDDWVLLCSIARFAEGENLSTLPAEEDPKLIKNAKAFIQQCFACNW